MESRDINILKHIGLYWISIRPILERTFFDGRKCGNVMHRLIKKDGYVQSRLGLHRTRSYYQLTERGASLLGLPRSRAASLGTQALPTRLAILWFCFMGQTRRYHLDRQRVRQMLGPDAPPGVYCLEESQPGRLYLMRVLGDRTSPANVLRALRNAIARVRQCERASEWMNARRLAFAVLVETKERAGVVKEAVSNYVDEDGPLHEQVYVHVAVAPGPRTLKEALRARAE